MSPHRQLRVLLVEDNLINQKVASRLLEMHGHAVVIAGNGREALDVLDEADFDLVLMDVQMPEMDGLTATAAIRKREQQSGRHLPIVALTANAMSGDRERCLEAGMDGYVAKPVEPHVLLREMAEALALVS
jgi:CheY-like chemotaxis protein